MNLQIAIPQLFYDLIARVVPGLFFLKSLEIVLRIDLLSAEPRNSVESTFAGLVYVAGCYVTGWLLATAHGRRFREREPRLMSLPPSCPPTHWDRVRKYDLVRLIAPETGMRIVKLRAERRMLQASSVGALAVAFILGLTLCIDWLEGAASRMSVRHAITRFIVLLAIYGALWVLARRVNKRFKRSVNEHFWLLWYTGRVIQPQMQHQAPEDGATEE